MSWVVVDKDVDIVGITVSTDVWSTSAGGQVLTHPGKGWYHYERTGQYYTWWT